MHTSTISKNKPWSTTPSSFAMAAAAAAPSLIVPSWKKWKCIVSIYYDINNKKINKLVVKTNKLVPQLVEIQITIK